MNITITTKNISLTESLQRHVEQSLEKTGKFLPDTHYAVEIGKITNHHKQGDIFKAEVSVQGNGDTYFIEKIEPDLYQAISRMADELFTTVAQKRDKKKTLLKRGQSLIKRLLRRSS